MVKIICLKRTMNRLDMHKITYSFDLLRDHLIVDGHGKFEILRAYLAGSRVMLSESLFNLIENE